MNKELTTSSANVNATPTSSEKQTSIQTQTPLQSTEKQQTNIQTQEKEKPQIHTMHALKLAPVSLLSFAPNDRSLNFETQRDLILAFLTRTPYGIKIQDRKYHFRTYKECFVSNEAVDWLLKYTQIISREDAGVFVYLFIFFIYFFIL
jgi:hypothetical protein